MINLLPYKEKKSIERVRGIRIAQTITFGVIVLVVISGVLLVPTLITINSRFAIANTQMSMLQKDGVIASDLDLSTLEKGASLVREKLSAIPAVQPTVYIALVQSLVPKGVTVDRFGTDDGALLEVFGASDTRETLQGFIHSLQADPRVALVDSPVSNFIKNKNGTFKLTVSFK